MARIASAQPFAYDFPPAATALVVLAPAPDPVAPDETALFCIGAHMAGLPTAAIDAVLAEVPPPLGFGTVNLQDGPCLGSLAEPAGLAAVPENAALGGRRAALARRGS